MKLNRNNIVRCFTAVVIGLVCLNMMVLLNMSGIRRFSQGQISPIQSDVISDGVALEQDRVAHASIIVTSTTTCPGLKKELGIIKTNDFQAVTGVGAFVYSAFLESDQIRLIAISLSSAPKPNLFCQIWYKDDVDEVLKITPARVDNIPESHGMRYTAAYIKCPLPTTRNALRPVGVSLVVKQCDDSANFILLNAPTTMSSEFVNCVSPLNLRYSRAYELVEMIELNKLLGSQKFIFYNHSTAPNVDKVLDFYSKLGEVEVLPWHLPVKTNTWPPSGQPEVHYFGQLAALNDCLYRYRNQSRYIVYQDMDEFIIPRKHDNWTSLLHSRNEHRKPFSAHQVRCVFFRKEWPTSVAGFLGNDIAVKYNSVVLRHTLREEKMFPYNVRSKYIVNPRQATTVGIHNLWKISGYVDRVPESVALLHHYRNWEAPNDNQPKVEDRYAVEKYGKALAIKLDEIWTKLRGIPLDNDGTF